MNIKDIFENAENGTLTYEQFSDAVSKGGAKFVDLSEGNYVSKQKYEDELARLEAERLAREEEERKRREEEERRIAEAKAEAERSLDRKSVV